MITRLFLIIVFILGSNAYAQKSDCKITLPGISGSYSGDCKNGLAHGKGIAQGIDHYEGQFIKGMPSGRGIYTWVNGTYYDGEWKNGMREGKGKMVYGDSIVTGFWKGDKFQGTKLVPPYRITINRSVSRYTINKTIIPANGVRIKIMQGGVENTSIEEFSLAYDSGEEYRMGNVYGIQNSFVPLDVKVRYRTWNQMHSVQYDVFFDFVINEPGTWEVILTN